MLTDEEMPLDSKCDMLFSATVSGMPELSRLANCWVKVASSWSLGRRLRFNNARSAGGNASADTDRVLRSVRSALTAPATLAASTATGKSPSRSM